MKKTLAVLFLGLGMAAAAQAQGPVKGDATAGQAKAAACGACHGMDGNSPAPTFPRLAGQHPKYTVKQLKDFQSGRRTNPTMAPMAAGLAEQDMADIAAYFASQKPGVGLAKPELAKAGEKLFRGGNPSSGLAPCAGCHGPAGAGNAAGGFPRLGGQHADYIAVQLRAFRAAGREDTTGDKRGNDSAKPDEKGMMQMVAAKLSDKEIDALASFISGLHRGN